MRLVAGGCGGVLGVGGQDQAIALEAAFFTIVESVPVFKPLGLLVAADLVKLLLLADQVQGKRQAAAVWQAAGAA